MTHYEANRILDRVREGQQFSAFVILRALELTGDYEGDGSQRMDQRGKPAAEDLRQRMNRIKNEIRRPS